MIVDSDVPYPANSGKRLRSLNLVLPLARRHRITYIARVGDPAEGRVAKTYLESQGIELVLVHDPLPAKSGLGFYVRLAANLMSTRPYSAVTHVSEAMRATVAAQVKARKPNVLQLEHVNYMYTVEGLDLPIVLQAHNVESLIWKRLASSSGNLLTKAYCVFEDARYRRFENRAYAKANRVVAVSEADAELARQIYDSPPMVVVDNGVDSAYFRNVGRTAGARNMLFVGALDWRPNIDAVGLLLKTILPALRQRVSDAQLVIVGRKPSPQLQAAIASTDGATLHADVPDVRPYMADSAVMAVPLRIGGGSRLKIIEALAAGLPVVSTAVGAEGLAFVNGEHLAIADDWPRFADALARAIESPQVAQEQAERGRALAVERYDWSTLSARLEQHWIAAANGG